MVILASPSEHGIYKVSTAKGKEKKELIWERCNIVNTTTGEILSKDIRPRFNDYTYDDYYSDFQNGELIRFIETMSAVEISIDSVEDLEGDVNLIAEIKQNGHRGTVHIGSDCIRVFSKRISKKTNWFKENSDQLPHIRDLRLPQLKGTILDAEVYWGKDSRSCQSVTGSLPENAIQVQVMSKQWAELRCFDILYYKGVNVQRMPLIKRKHYLNKVILEIQKQYAIEYINALPIYAFRANFDYLVENRAGRILKMCSLQSLFKEMVEKGEEGLVIKPLNGIYEQGKDSKAYMKLKKFSTWDCVVMGLSEPEREYTGKKIIEDKLDEWPYWENERTGELIDYDEAALTDDPCLPVTKPYAHGWCGGIRCGVWKEVDWNYFVKDCGGKLHAEATFDQCKHLGIMRKDKKTGLYYELVEVVTAKGLSEELMQDLKDNIEEYVRNHQVVEIMAQEIIDKKKGSLQHPRFFQFRDDKDHKSCTWNKHVRSEE